MDLWVTVEVLWVVIFVDHCDDRGKNRKFTDETNAVGEGAESRSG